MLLQQYEALLNKIPRRTNECWLGDLYSDKGVFVAGHKFLIHLEGTAQRIWQLMDGHRTVNKIVDHLYKEHHSAKREIILEDTIRYILHLEKAGIAAWRFRPMFEGIELDD